MYLQKLGLVNFRCYPLVEVQFSDRINIIYGQNGQGKTSLVEAIVLLSGRRSFRSVPRNSEFIRRSVGNFDEAFCAVKGDFLNHEGSFHQLELKLSEGHRSLRLNQKAVKSLKDMLRSFGIVTFTPFDLDLLRSSPEGRRQWIDSLLFIQDESYLPLLQSWTKVLQNRNRLLKALSEGTLREPPLDFDIWTDQWIELSAQVIHKRIHIVDNFSESLTHAYSQIARTQEKLLCSYESCLPELTSRHSVIDITQMLRLELQKVQRREQAYGSTLVGPHRDDFVFSLNDHSRGLRSLRTQGSQGEVRSAALALRLIEIEFYRKEWNRDPLLLIDDFSSELDESRRKFLLEYLTEFPSQVFVTATEPLPFGSRYHVVDGKVQFHA